MTSDLSVMIVDDDPVSLQLLQAILEEAGFRVTALERPKAALERIREQPPDLLITDLRMPEMSGVDLLEAVRALEVDTCCLVITGFASDEATAEAYRAGARDLLLKPINITEVQARVQNAAELVRLRREVRLLRGARSSGQVEIGPGDSAPRARELADLPSLPGAAGPVDVAGRDEILHRLERLGALYRQGIISASEFEEKKRSLLARL